MKTIILFCAFIALAGCASNQLPECESTYAYIGYRDIPTPCIGTFTRGGQQGTAVRMVVVRTTAGEYISQEIRR